MEERSRHVKAVLAALRLLDAFEDGRPLRFADLVKRTGLNRSRILRYVGTLDAAGYIVVNERDGLFELGPKAYRFGWVIKQEYEPTITLLRPRLERLSEHLGATTFFSVIRGRSRLVVAKCEPREGVRYAVEEGQIRPLHIGATGRVLLAFAPDHLVADMLKGELEALTPQSITDPAVLAQFIETARQQGFAVSIGEATGEALALAVPVLDVSGRLVGSLTTAGPSNKLSPIQEQARKLLLEEAAFLRSRLSSTGYQ